MASNPMGEPESDRARREGTALCLSGGGFRAALFHLGALRRLSELGVLSQVDTISAVYTPTMTQVTQIPAVRCLPGEPLGPHVRLSAGLHPVFVQEIVQVLGAAVSRGPLSSLYQDLDSGEQGQPRTGDVQGIDPAPLGQDSRSRGPGQGNHGLVPGLGYLFGTHSTSGGAVACTN